MIGAQLHRLGGGGGVDHDRRTGAAGERAQALAHRVGSAAQAGVDAAALRDVPTRGRWVDADHARAATFGPIRG